MGRSNPRKAVAAIVPREVAGVKPMTLGMWAVLERIDSPLVTGREPKDALELLPSLYLITHGCEAFFKGNLVALAMEWADTVPVTEMERIQSACKKQMTTVFDVIPEDDSKEDSRKKPTGRSRSSLRGRPQTQDGAGGKSSGKSRSRRSA